MVCVLITFIWLRDTPVCMCIRFILVGSCLFAVHFTRIYVCCYISICIYYCLHYILIPFSAIAKCMVFVTILPFLGWAHAVCMCVFFTSAIFFLSPLSCLDINDFFFVFVHFQLSHIFFYFSVLVPFTIFCVSLCTRLNKLPKVYYICFLFLWYFIAFEAPLFTSLAFCYFAPFPHHTTS